MRSLTIAAIALCLTPAWAGREGQIDTFDDDLHGWRHGAGSPIPPVRVETGGPDGEGDAYMLVAAHGGAGAGSKLIAYNQARWDMDVAGAGVGQFEMDLRNEGEADVTIRLAFRTPNGNRTMQHHVLLEAGSDWSHEVFPLAELDGLVITEMRILHSPNPAFRGAVIGGEFSVDNITAVAGPPEPDAGPPDPDAGLPDGGAIMHPDLGMPVPDAGGIIVVPDGALQPDAEPLPELDAAIHHPDFASLDGDSPDAAGSAADALVPDPDGAAPDPDAAAPDPDAAAPDPDAAAPDPDAAAPDPDGAAPDPDGATPDPDAAPDPEGDTGTGDPADAAPDDGGGDDDGGCDCDVAGSNPTVAWWALLLVGIRRRRRR